MVAQIGVAGPSFPPRLLEYLQLLAEHGFWQQRRERVMVGKADEIKSPTAERSCPAFRLTVAVPPTAAITELIICGEIADIIDQRTRVTKREPGLIRNTRQRIARASLICSAPIV